MVQRPVSDASLEDILPAELVVLLTTLTLSPEDFEQRKSKNKPPKPSMDASQASLLAKTLQSKLSQYGTSLSEDTQLLGSIPLQASLEGSARRQRMALQVRIGEKEVIQTVLSMLEPITGGSSLKRSANGDGPDSRQAKTPRF